MHKSFVTMFLILFEHLALFAEVNSSAQAVGSALNNLIPVATSYPTTDLAFIESQLSTLSLIDYNNALYQIAPASGLIGVAQESFNTTKQFQKLWLEHLSQYRPPFLYPNSYDSCDPYTEMLQGPTYWIDGFGYYGHQNRKQHYNGYKTNSWGTMIAVEMPLPNNLRTGCGAGYAYTNLDENAFRNNTRIHTYQGIAYFDYQAFPWFVDGGVSFNWNRYDGHRHLRFGAVDRTARAKYNGREYTGFMVTGYDLICYGFKITPFASVIYSHLQLNKYTEKGAHSLNLQVKKQHYNFTESGLGVKAAYIFPTTLYGDFIPEVHTSWIHDFGGHPLHVHASFKGLGSAAGTFHNRGPGADLNTWNLGASLTWMSACHFSLLALYDYERSKSYFSHQGLLKCTYDF